MHESKNEDMDFMIVKTEFWMFPVMFAAVGVFQKLINDLINGDICLCVLFHVISRFTVGQLTIVLMAIYWWLLQI